MDFKRFNDKDLDRLKEFGLESLETQLMYILDEGVPISYQPSENVLAMAVACGKYIREASMIRALHKSRFQIPSDRVVVIGCDKEELRPERHSEDDDYDLMLRGYSGDASCDYPWTKGLRHCGNGHLNYNFAHINYPDLFDMDSWLAVTEKALENLSKGGILSIINVDNKDITKLLRLQQELRQTQRHQVDEVQGFRYETPTLSFNYGLLCVQKTSD